MKFAAANQLRLLSEYLPTSYDSALAPHNYEMVLYEYLHVDYEVTYFFPRSKLKKLSWLGLVLVCTYCM